MFVTLPPTFDLSCEYSETHTRMAGLHRHFERFWIECRKTKTKVITTANQNKGKYHKEPMRTQSKHT